MAGTSRELGRGQSRALGADRWLQWEEKEEEDGAWWELRTLYRREPGAALHTLHLPPLHVASCCLRPLLSGERLGQSKDSEQRETSRAGVRGCWAGRRVAIGHPSLSPLIGQCKPAPRRHCWGEAVMRLVSRRPPRRNTDASEEESAMAWSRRMRCQLEGGGVWGYGRSWGPAGRRKDRATAE